MRHLAALSVAAILLLVVVVVYFIGEHGIDDTVTTNKLLFGPGESITVFTYMNSINNVVFAYNNQFNVPQLTGELTPKPQVTKMTNVALVTTAMCFLLYTGVSL